MSNPLTEQSTAAFLHAHGIGALLDSLGEMVSDAVARLHRTLYPADPRHDLPVPDVAALERGGFDLAPRLVADGDALERTAADFAALLQTSLTTKKVAARLGVATSRVRQRLGGRPPTLYGVRHGGSWRIPAFQFTSDGPLPGLGAVIARLDPALSPVAVQRWFTTAHTDLLDRSTGRSLSPRDWLRAGGPPDVVASLAARV